MVQERRPIDLIAPSDAAAELGVSVRRVYDLIASGRLAAERIGQRLVVDRAAVDAWDRVRSPGGQPFSPRRAWGLLLLADGESAPWLDPVSLSKLRAILRHRSLRELRNRLERRAERHAFRAHPSDLSRLASEPGVMRSGASAARDVGVDLVASDFLDAYVPGPRLDRLVRRYRLRPSREPNVILRRLPDVPFRWESRAVAPAAAVAIDLAEESDPRSQEAAERALRRYER
jgi:excisionase family DNA binding protein